MKGKPARKRGKVLGGWFEIAIEYNAATNAQILAASKELDAENGRGGEWAMDTVEYAVLGLLEDAINKDPRIKALGFTIADAEYIQALIEREPDK